MTAIRATAAALAIEMVDEPYSIAPFSFCHHPDIATPGYALAGHGHPAYVLASRFEALRQPCFVVGTARTILPSFGAFTGGFTVTPESGDDIYVSPGEAVHFVR